jgi:effector-binding domain-containing protein
MVMTEIAVVETKPQLVLGLRQRGGYAEISSMIRRLFEFAMGERIAVTGPPIFVCHEMTPQEAVKADQEKNADLEVAVPIAEEVDGTDDIKCYQLPGGKMAKTLHKGPYEDCGPTYEKLFTWLRENEKILAGPTREMYLNDPREVPPEEILTEIYAPIK